MKPERERQIPCDITYMWSLKYNANDFIYKQTHRHREQTCGSQGEEGLGRDGLGIWDQQCKQLHIKWINNKVLLYITGTYSQYPVMKKMEKNMKRAYTYV